MSEYGSSSLWSEIDAIQCINLRSRPDRKRDTVAQFEKVGLSQKVDFYLAERNTKGSIVGCYDSHRACIQKSYDKGCSTVLVFEDDIIFHDGWKKVVHDCLNFLRCTTDDEVDVVLLGGQIQHVHKDCGALWKASVLFAHAYIMTRQGMARFLERMPVDYASSAFSKIAHDQAWGVVLPNMFVHKCHQVINQRWQDTDNLWFDNLGIDIQTARWIQLELCGKAVVMQTKLIVLMANMPTFWRNGVLRMNKVPIGLHFPKTNTVFVCNGGLLANLASVVIILLNLITICAPPCGYLRTFPALLKAFMKLDSMGKSIKSGVYDVRTIRKAK